jgi:GTP-binding protein
MPKFSDTITIRVKAGDGGPGSVSFRREKYVEFGGPDGGDGGKGGDVYIEADRRYYNLSHFFRDRTYSARKGGHGMGRNRHGANGEDLTIPVPPGTQVINRETGELIVDMIQDGGKFLVARGGIGGHGNAFFKSSTFQTPRMAQPGLPGEEFDLELNLKLIADIGLVGLPNAGKSTLLAMLTAAKPKIADYPFTTLIPNLGVLTAGNRTIQIADIPGIIEGAHMGHGLGLSFLQHIERLRAILFKIDISGEDLAYNFNLLQEELRTYNEELLDRPYYILLTKTDLVDEEERAEKLKELEGRPALPISAIGGENMDELLSVIVKLMEDEDASQDPA